MIIFIEVASKPKKCTTIIKQNACPKWSSWLRLLQNPKKISSSWSAMHAKNDHLHWGGLETKKKSITIIKQNACQKWSSSLRLLQNPQKKVSSSWSAMHAKNDRDDSGGFKTKKKKYHQHWTNPMTKWSFSSMGLKKTSKTDHNPKKSISMTEQISCHSMSKMIIIIEDVLKHLKTP